MKGGASKVVPPKPATKPAAPKATAAASTTASTPAPSVKPAVKSAAAKAQSSDEDDPFGVGAASASRAVPLLPRPAKGKTQRLVCPMCETPGFASADVAGKEVKCCNEKCPLPIFTAPKSGADTVSTAPAAHPMGAPIPAAAKKTSPALVATAVGTVALAAGSVWYFVFNDPMANVQKAAPAPTGTSSSSRPVTVADPDAIKPTTETKSVEKTPGERAAELRSQIMAAMVEVARAPDKNNRSKPLCRRLTAEAYIDAGDLKSASENLAQLVKVGPKLGFHQTPPLVQIAWNAADSGDAASAKATLDEALKVASSLPSQGRLTFDSFTDLAALLFISGRADEAQKLLHKDSQNSSLPKGYHGTLPALIRRAQLLRHFHLDDLVISLPIVFWKSPEWVVTTITLTLRGHADKGLEWAKLASDPEVKADSLAAWANAVVVAPKSTARDNDDAFTAAVKDESPAAQARVWARAAAARAAAGQKAAAERALGKAVSAIKSESPPSDFVLPDIKELSRLEIPDATTPRLNAIAAAEVARAQTLLGQTEPAGESLAAALQHLRGHAPSPFAAERRMDAISRDQADVMAQIKKALELRTDDQVRQAFTKYRAKCRSLLDAANARFALQTEILMAAVDWPLVEEVWNEATLRSSASTPDESREEFLKSPLSVRLGQQLRAAGQIDRARVCESAVTAGQFTDLREAIERETAEAATKGDVATIANRLNGYPPKQDSSKPAAAPANEDADWPLLWALRLAGRLVKAGRTDKAFELVASLRDFLAREEGYELLGNLVGNDLPQVEALWKKHRTGPLTPTEKIALFRGLCAGLTTLTK